MSTAPMLCHICNSPAKNVCALCGKSACDRHFDRKNGLCHVCAAGRRL
jgi:hypothetical protein